MERHPVFDPIFSRVLSQKILDYFLEHQTVGECEPWTFVYVTLGEGEMHRHFELCAQREKGYETLMIYDLDYCDEPHNPAYRVGLSDFINVLKEHDV